MCLLCRKYKDREDILMENETCFAIKDDLPINFGHILVATKECRESYFELSYKEHEDMVMLIKNCKSHMDNTVNPDGYNIGYNIGWWAGQTINHCYADVIPRYAGDVPITELKGGIRNFKEPMKEEDYSE